MSKGAADQIKNLRIQRETDREARRKADKQSTIAGLKDATAAVIAKPPKPKKKKLKR